VRCTQRTREFAWTGHTQPAEFPLPTQSCRSSPATHCPPVTRKRRFGTCAAPTASACVMADTAITAQGGRRGQNSVTPKGPPKYRQKALTTWRLGGISAKIGLLDSVYIVV